MNLAKAQKRLAKLHKQGMHGYPLIEVHYYAGSSQIAEVMTVSLTSEAGATPYMERFTSSSDIREDHVMQTTLLKIIERTQAQSVQIYPELLASQ